MFPSNGVTHKSQNFHHNVVLWDLPTLRLLLFLSLCVYAILAVRDETKLVSDPKKPDPRQSAWRAHLFQRASDASIQLSLNKKKFHLEKEQVQLIETSSFTVGSIS